MTNKEKLEAIKAEIERRRSLFRAALQDDAFKGKDRADVCLRYEELGNIFDFINSLPEEPVSEDLEKAINFYIENNFFGSETLGFFSNRTKEEPNDQDIALAFKAGAMWQKEQMMAKAIEGIVTTNIDGWINVMTGFIRPEEAGANFGNKVKVIIIKEEGV